MLKYFTTIFFMCVVVYTSAQQNQIDSLKKQLPSLYGSAKIDCLLKISFAYGHVDNDSDNLFNYINADSAKKYAISSLEQSKKINYKKGMANAYENLGELAFLNNYVEGENYFRQAIPAYINVYDREKLNWSYLWLGYYEMLQGKFAESRSFFEKALSYYKDVKNKKREARTYTLIALSYEDEGYFAKSFEYCLKNISILENGLNYLDDPIFLAERIGDLFLSGGDTAAAISYYRQCTRYAKNYKQDFFAELLGTINLYEHNYDSAVYYYKLDDSSEHNSNLGTAYFLKNEYNKAYPYFFISLADAKSKNSVVQILAYSDDIAKSYLYQKKWKQSLHYAKQLFEIATRIHARQFIKKSNWLLWNIYNKEDKMDSAYKYRLQFDIINDSIAQDQLARDLAVTEMKFDDEQKQSQINLLRKNNQINQQQLKNESLQKDILIAIISATIILSFIVLRTLTLKRKNEKLESEKKQSELQSKASELEIQALRSQMNPHFIFNCLSSINSFILKSKTEEASKYLTKFSRLIRMVLNNSKQSFISLEDELETLRLYLDMERLRFRNSFEYAFNLSENVEVENVFVPPLLLQPFAENAIWHGLMHKQQKGFLTFDFCVEEKYLICVITDNGIGRKQAELLKSKSSEKQKSMGLKITTERLSLLNNQSDKQTFFTIEDLKDDKGNVSGTGVHLKISYKKLSEV